MTSIQVRDGAAWKPATPRVYLSGGGWTYPKQALTWDGERWVRAWPANAGPVPTLAFSPAAAQYRDGQAVTITAAAAGVAQSQLRIEWSGNGGATWNPWVNGQGSWTFRNEGTVVTFRAVWPGDLTRAPSVSASESKSVGGTVPTSLSVAGTGFTFPERQQSGVGEWWVTTSAPQVLSGWIKRPDGSWGQYFNQWVPAGQHYFTTGGFWRGQWEIQWSGSGGDGYEPPSTESGSWIQQILETRYSTVVCDPVWDHTWWDASGAGEAETHRQGKSGSYSWRAMAGYANLGRPEGVPNRWVANFEIRAMPNQLGATESAPSLWKAWHIGTHHFDSRPPNGALSAPGVYQALVQIGFPQRGKESVQPWQRWYNEGLWAEILSLGFRGLVWGGKFNGAEAEYASTLPGWKIRITWGYQVWID